MRRRRFLATVPALAAAPLASAAAGSSGSGPAPAPTILRARTQLRPLVLASDNGHKFRDGGPRTCVEEAFLRVARGEDVLDALLAGVNIVERDPLEDSVGYGGLPNADGVVQLDASVMHGPRRRAGAVAALEGVRTPSLVARDVMNQTDHHLLVGRGAQLFARQLGHTIEDDLNTPRSRKLWLEWKRRIDPAHYLDPEKRGEAGQRATQEMLAEGLLRPGHLFGTIHASAINTRGEICAVTTTSGLAWKIPGRVGDSPILGAGLYVDGEVGAAGSTGRGEANLYNLSSFLIVELLRQGRHPKDAGMEALRRIQRSTMERRLLDAQGRPAFNVKFYVLDQKGRYAVVSLLGGNDAEYSLCDEAGARVLRADVLLA